MLYHLRKEESGRGSFGNHLSESRDLGRKLIRRRLILFEYANGCFISHTTPILVNSASFGSIGLHRNFIPALSSVTIMPIGPKEQIAGWHY